MKNLKISDYIAPRIDPLLHPGKRPPDSYVMDGDNNIFLIRDIEKGIKMTYIETPEGQVRINDFLKHYQIASLEERIPVIAYGTNPCPGQLKYKFVNLTEGVLNKEQDYRVGVMSDFQIKEAGGLEFFKEHLLT